MPYVAEKWQDMRILVLTQVVIYPADAGPKIKTLQVVRHLAKQHEIIYCTFVRSEQEAREAGQLRDLCQRMVTVPIQRSRLSDAKFLLESLLTGDSFLLRRDERAAMRSAVRQLIQEERIELIHVDQLNMMRFVPPDWSGRVVLDEHNAVWQVVERLREGSKNPLARLLLGREVALMRRFEGDACRRAQVVLAVSEQDKRALREVAGEQAMIEVVPITVDVAHFASIRAARAPQPARLFTIGTMFWPPNSEGVVWWLQSGYHLLRNTRPDVTYDIVGARPPRLLQQLADGMPGVHVHGYVADANPFWTSATALVVPLLSGGGVRVKILEAMAMGVPVISTSIGCEGLAVRHEEHLLIADTPEALVTACERLLLAPELAALLARNALRCVQERYDAPVALQSLEHIYDRW